MSMSQDKLYTLADILEWDEGERAEVIDGSLYMMATPSRIHQKISGELFGQLREYLRGKQCEVYAAPFAVRLFEGAEDSPENVYTMVEPDISVICSPEKLDDMGCKGAPDLIIEILSPSTRRHDRLTKFNLYQRAGVREYWIVDPSDRSVQSFLLENNAYIARDFAVNDDKITVNVLQDCVIDLAPVFAR
ncbi:MAG: Uma2 family endonuclease [Oscillospiraceae bacterium]|nr:Uma2 family endonuclease [Oscillospiraceae bacterium]